jgi:hypothetical protein
MKGTQSSAGQNLVPHIFCTVGLCYPALVHAQCVYDAELGEYRDSPALLIGISMLLMGVLLAYPLKDWAEEHPGLAALGFFGVPILLGVMGSGSCTQP